jgi:preprotein translocase subunit SecG
MLITKLLIMVILSFVITLLILLRHLQTSPWKMTVTSALSVNQDRHSQVLRSFCIFLVKLYNCCLLTLCNHLKVSVHPLWDREVD